MRQLNFPAYEFRRREQSGKAQVFDPVRRLWVRLTPEEWVRQHLVQYLLRDRGVPAGLVAVEKAFLFQGMTWRADVVVHGRSDGEPVLVAECKAPGVKVTQATFDQVARYNRVAGAGCLVVTNGDDHYCCLREAGAYRFVERVPPYEALLEKA